MYLNHVLVPCPCSATPCSTTITATIPFDSERNSKLPTHPRSRNRDIQMPPPSGVQCGVSTGSCTGAMPTPGRSTYLLTLSLNLPPCWPRRHRNQSHDRRALELQLRLHAHSTHILYSTNSKRKAARMSHGAHTRFPTPDSYSERRTQNAEVRSLPGRAPELNAPRPLMYTYAMIGLRLEAVTSAPFTRTACPPGPPLQLRLRHLSLMHLEHPLLAPLLLQLCLPGTCVPRAYPAAPLSIAICPRRPSIRMPPLNGVHVPTRGLGPHTVAQTGAPWRQLILRSLSLSTVDRHR
ncbi:hypothetical protein DENSPDRAFT_701260 [Dentipellis sp. KUC8613]|nr:hypothetical protein DENSPDRAFT_701260 [Dentipellis sp. KUC8613]